MEFLVPEVAAKYKPVVEKDRIVHAYKTYSGKLSTIPIEVADQLFDAGNTDLISLKGVVVPGSVAAVAFTPDVSTSCKSVGK